MQIYLGLLAGSLPHQTRIFGDVDGRLVDLNLAYTAYLTQSGDPFTAYERAAFYFPETIDAFLARGKQSLQALEEVVSYARKTGARDLRSIQGQIRFTF